MIHTDGTPTIANGAGDRFVADTNKVLARLEEIRAEIRAERVSYGELAELQSLAAHIDEDDAELRSWVGSTMRSAVRRG
jgi:hypothetical protein